MQVENITGISLTTRGTTEKEGHLVIQYAMACLDKSLYIMRATKAKINVKSWCKHDLLTMFAIVMEPFTHCTTREGSKVMITNDELMLAMTDQHHEINEFNASHDRLVHRAMRENSGSLQRGMMALSGLNRALGIR